MRYQRIQIIKTTVCDEELDDAGTIRSLMNHLAEADVDIIIRYKDPSIYDPKEYDKARIELFENVIN